MKTNLYYEKNKLENEERFYQNQIRRKRRNRGLVAVVILILIFSILNMLSASFYTIYIGGTKKIFLHCFYIFLGIIFGGIATSINYKKYNQNRFCGLIILTTFSVFLFIVIGSKIQFLKSVIPQINGAIGWIRIWKFSVQPVEFFKLGFIIVIAHLLEKCEKEKFNGKKIFFTTLPIIVLYFIFILLQKDLGTAIHYCGIFIFMLFLTEINLKYISLAFGLFIIGVGTIFYYISRLGDLSGKGYKLRRIESFVNGLVYNQYDNAIGYQVGQSLIGFGSGGITGKGYGNGVQKYSYLPEIRTDFIITSFGEEFGFLGILMLLVLFLIIFNMSKAIALETKDYFGKYLAMGIGGYLIIQFLINLCVTLGILPVFGIPMPFFSYGGTSIITVMIAMGLLININNNGYKRNID